jgi:membrane protease subunit (stomatin/prohibitin family)
MQMPFAGVMVATTHLEEDGAEEQLGSMGAGAGVAVGGVEVVEVEACDGVFDDAGEAATARRTWRAPRCGAADACGRCRCPRPSFYARVEPAQAYQQRGNDGK